MLTRPQISRARNLLEKARVKIPQSPELWLETVRLELDAGEEKLAQTRMAQALQECPHSGILWSDAIMMEGRARRKARTIDAIKACENDPVVISTAARLFWQDRKIEKARTWFHRAVTLNPDLVRLVMGGTLLTRRPGRCMGVVLQVRAAAWGRGEPERADREGEGCGAAARRGVAACRKGCVCEGRGWEVTLGRRRELPAAA